jgi:hypothetical protein
MKTTIRAVALLAAVSATSPALAQQATEDWDLTTNADQQLTLATLDFGANVLALRCRAGALDMLLTGVPVSTGATRKVQVSVGPIVAEDQVWIAQPGQPVLGADEPARLARQLRAGGDLDIRLDPEDPTDRSRRYRLTAPASAAAVNTVLTACDQALDEPRDLLLRLPAGEGPVWARPPEPAYPSGAVADNIAEAVVRVSCVIAPDWSTDDCRVESENPQGHGFGDSAVAAGNQAQLGPPASGVDTRGRLARFSVRFVAPPT